MRKIASIPLITLLVIAVLLVALHFSLAFLVRNLLNENMEEMGEYRGHVESVELFWWKGAYRLNNLNIEKADGSAQVPFLKAPVIDISVSWRALWYDRALVAVVHFVEPELNFVDGETDGERQDGRGVDWRDTLQDQVPIRLNELQIENGTLAFRNFSSDPPVNVYAQNVQLTVYNLSNARDVEGTRDASLEGTASFLGHAPIEVAAYFDPLVRMEDFDFRLRVTGVDLTRLNDFSSAYGKFDFHAGTGDLVIEAESKDDSLQGYIKPLLHNVEVFDLEQDLKNEDKGFLRGLWEAIVHGGEAVLRNQRKDQFATRVELSGSIGNTEVSAFQAFIQILRNAFVEAFSTRFERSLDAEDE